MSTHSVDTVLSWKRKLLKVFRSNDQSKLAESKKVGLTKMIQPLVLPQLLDEDSKSSHSIIVILHSFNIYILEMQLDVDHFSLNIRKDGKLPRLLAFSNIVMLSHFFQC